MAWKTILWDWNGTLLDDVETALAVNNEIFPIFGLAPLGDLADYHKVFRFPIRDYYRDVGVTDELFDDVAQAWSAGYMKKSEGCCLQKGALEALEAFSKAGLSQVILSASKREHLHEQIARFPIGQYFDDALGLSHIYATSKVELARDYLKTQNLEPREALFLGDTLHDAEVAKAIGCDCMLIARGHQARETLETAGVPILNDLCEATQYILNLNRGATEEA